MDRFGRLKTLAMASIPGCGGCVIMALSQNVPMLIAGRGLIGFAAAIGANPAIVYLTEIARKDMRGSLISFGPALSSLGTAAFSQRVVLVGRFRNGTHFHHGLVHELETGGVVHQHLHRDSVSCGFIHARKSSLVGVQEPDRRCQEVVDVDQQVPTTNREQDTNSGRDAVGSFAERTRIEDD
jgi:hypothetical protein